MKEPMTGSLSRMTSELMKLFGLPTNPDASIGATGEPSASYSALTSWGSPREGSVEAFDWSGEPDATASVSASLASSANAEAGTKASESDAAMKQAVILRASANEADVPMRPAPPEYVCSRHTAEETRATRCCPFKVFSSLKMFSKNEEGIHHSG